MDLRTTPDDQDHPKDPPEPSPDTRREPSVFSVPFGLSPRTPEDDKMTPKATQGLFKNLPRPLRGPKEAKMSSVNLWKIISKTTCTSKSNYSENFMALEALALGDGGSAGDAERLQKKIKEIYISLYINIYIYIYM